MGDGSWARLLATPGRCKLWICASLDMAVTSTLLMRVVLYTGKRGVQVFVRERMALMQQPYLSNDVFEMRVLNRQARKRSVGDTFASTLQRVKGSSRGAAFAQWTGKNTQGLMALGKKFGSNMMSALSRFEARAAAFAGVDTFFCVRRKRAGRPVAIATGFGVCNLCCLCSHGRTAATPY
jgi:hypothetical protein